MKTASELRHGYEAALKGIGSTPSINTLLLRFILLTLLALLENAERKDK